MIKGDIDLTKDLDFYHDNYEKFKDNTVSGCCPWELDSAGILKIDNSTYSVPDQTVEYNNPPDVNLDVSTFQENSFIPTTTYVQPVSLQYNADNAISTISYNTQNRITDNYYIDYSDDQFINYAQITISGIESSTTYKLKWDTSAKLNYESEIDCFGYNKKEKFYKSIFAMLSEFEDRPKKHFPLIPWNNDDNGPMALQYYNRYHIIGLPWDIVENPKIKPNNYYHGIPWLDKLNHWVREDYIDELDGDVKDNTKFLTDTRWFHTSRNYI